MGIEKSVCEAIRAYYPEVGKCGDDVDVSFSDDTDHWTVEMTTSDGTLSASVSAEDVVECVEDGKCTSVAVTVVNMIAERDSRERTD